MQIIHVRPGKFGPASLLSATGDANRTGWNGFGLRNVYPTSQFAALTFTPKRIRFKLVAATVSEGCSVAGMTFGHAASSGDAYDFDSTPTAVTFSGSATVTVPVNTELWSDWMPISWITGRNLVVALGFSDSANDNTRGATLSGAVCYQKSAASGELNTANVTGYSTNASNLNLALAIDVDDG